MADPKILFKLIKMLRQIWKVTRSDFDQASLAIKGVFEHLPEIFAEIELDNDIRNRKEVYLGIAKFIKEKFNQPIPLCLSATHILCKETDERLLEDGVPDANRLAQSVKDLIVTIKVYYEPLDERKYNRIIEIYFLKGSQPSVSKVREELEWDRLPSDVREHHICKGAETQIFKLYPKG